VFLCDPLFANCSFEDLKSFKQNRETRLCQGADHKQLFLTRVTKRREILRKDEVTVILRTTQQISPIKRYTLLRWNEKRHHEATWNMGS
jgi:hypothetical protein